MLQVFSLRPSRIFSNWECSGTSPGSSNAQQRRELGRLFGACLAMHEGPRTTNPSEPAGISTTFAGSPRFSVGDPVRISMRFPVGHYRTPMYVRGKVGCVERVLPRFLNPEQEGYGKNSGALVRLYRVRIPQKAIWPDYRGNSADELQIEIYEHWLEPA